MLLFSRKNEPQAIAHMCVSWYGGMGEKEPDSMIIGFTLHHSMQGSKTLEQENDELDNLKKKEMVLTLATKK